MSKIPFSAYDFFGYLASGAIVLAALDRIAGSEFVGSDWTVAEGFLAVIAIYVAGHAVAQISSVIVENGIVRRLLRSPEEWLLSASAPSVRSKLFPGHYKPLPAETIARIESVRLASGAPKDPRAFFFHAHRMAENHPVTQDRLAVFLNLYGFARNMSLALIVACGMLLLGSWASGTIARRPTGPWLWWSLAALAGAVVMFYRYLKFFRAYTAEVFLSYATTVIDPSKGD